jgi:hypothetical protein
VTAGRARPQTLPAAEPEAAAPAAATRPASPAGLLALVGALAAVAVVAATGMGRAPERVDDEGTYVAQAWAVQHWHTLAHYTYWYDHPPLGWLLIAAWTATTGAFTRAGSAVAAGRELMLGLQLLSCWLLYGLARRLGLRWPAAVAAVLLFGLSPLAVGFHRAVYLDNVATPFLLAAFLLALSPERRLAAHAAGGLCFAAAVLAKETSLLLLPALAWQYWQASDPRTRRYSLAMAGSLFAVVCSGWVLYAALRGELLPGPSHVSLVDAVRYQLAGRAPSGSPLDPHSLGRRTVDLWLGQDPWLLGAAAVLVPAGLAARRLRPVTAAFAILALTALRPGYLPVPLVIPMLPFASLLVAGVADTAWNRLPALVVACLVAALVVVGPVWRDRDRDLMTVDHDAPFRRAEAWITANAPHRARLLVDDAVWVDLVRRGYPPEQVVWFYKLDTDREVTARFPRGWHDLDYVVSTATVRGYPDSLPRVADALRHSRVVAVFGRGDERVEVRKLEGSPV